MKRVIIFVTVALVVLPALDTVFARGRGGGGTRAGKSGAQVKAQEKANRAEAARPAGDKDEKQRLEKERRERIRDKARKQVRQSREQLQKKMRERASEAKRKTGAKGKLAEKKAGRDEAKGKSVEQSKGQGKEHKQQATAAAKQAANEKAKHRRREARLNRIRELAEQQGNTQMVQRVDKLMTKEQKRYERQMESMVQRNGRVEQLSEKVKDRSDNINRPGRGRGGDGDNNKANEEQ